MERPIVIRDFGGIGDHLYEDQLGWGHAERLEARSNVSKKIFEQEVVKAGLNMSFYYVDNDTFYGIHTEEDPTPIKILPRDRNVPYIGRQCDGNTHSVGEVIAEFENPADIWNNLKIDGKTLEQVLERSYIMDLC